MRDKALRERIMEMRRTFTRYEKDMVGIALVAHKPEAGSEAAPGA